MTNDEITAFIGRHADGWNRRDPVALSRGHAEDGVVISPMFGRVEGRAQIRGIYAALFTAFPDWEIQLRHPHRSGQPPGCLLLDHGDAPG